MPDERRESILIGVAGHRRLVANGALLNGISEALAAIKSAYPQSSFGLMSSLAEGADRLIAEAAQQQLGVELIAVLPMPSDAYERDFNTQDSQDRFRELLGVSKKVVETSGGPSREQKYKAAGEFIAHHCDVFIAVWDGEPAQGVGGTAEIVALVRQLEKPLAIVTAGNREPGTDLPTVAVNQGEVSLERFEESHASAGAG